MTALAFTSIRTSASCLETLMLLTTGGAGIFVAVWAKAACANNRKAPSLLALIISLPFFFQQCVAALFFFFPGLNHCSRCAFTRLPPVIKSSWTSDEDGIDNNSRYSKHNYCCRCVLDRFEPLCDKWCIGRPRNSRDSYGTLRIHRWRRRDSRGKGYV